MVDVIHYYKETGKQGGQEGYDVNFSEKIIYYSHGNPESFSKDNISIVQFVIEENIKNIQAKILKIIEQLSITKETYIPIPDGHKILLPLTDKMRKSLILKKESIEEDLLVLSKIDPTKLI